MKARVSLKYFASYWGLIKIAEIWTAFFMLNVGGSFLKSDNFIWKTGVELFNLFHPQLKKIHFKRNWPA